MERRTALIAAATTSLTLLAGAVAIGINTQLVDASDNDGVGEISPVSDTQPPATVYVDEPAGPADPSASSDDVYDDDGHEDEDRHEDDDRYSDEDHEYEGAEDDD